MSSTAPQPRTMTSLERLAHIPLISAGISSLHATLSSTPIINIAYNLSLSISSRLKPYVSSASAHYPFAPVLSYGDCAANKTLDIAQDKWPYPFKSKPDQVWNDVRTVAEQRVVQPAYGVAKSVDQSLTPLVNSFSFVVHKIDSHADEKAHPSPDDYQLRRAYSLLLVLKDDLFSTANHDKNAIMKNIHTILTRLNEQSASLYSRGGDAAARVQELAYAVLAELDKLAPLLSSFTSNASTTVKNTATNLRTILESDEALGQKIPKLRAAIQEGIKDVVQDVTSKVSDIVDDIRSSSSPTSSSPTTPGNNHVNNSKSTNNGRSKKLTAQVNGAATSASPSRQAK